MIDTDCNNILFAIQFIPAGQDRTGVGGKTAAMDIDKNWPLFIVRSGREHIQNQAVLSLLLADHTLKFRMPTAEILYFVACCLIFR